MSMNFIKIVGFIGCALLGLIVSAEKALAVPSCAVTFSAVAFGANIDVLSGASVDSAGTATITCTNFGSGSNANVVACISLNNGANATGAPRRMASGANRLSYDLYTDSNRQTRWTNTNASLPWFVMTNSVRSVAVPVYGRINAAQTTTPVGSYVDTITPIVYWINYSGTRPTCSSLTNTIAVSNFQVTGTVTPNCSISATNLIFQTQSVIQTFVDGQSSVLVSCTTNAPYWIALDGGSSAATDPTRRLMRLGTQTITYGLYRNAARSLPWGATMNVNTNSGTGTATSTTFPVYGRIPVQTTPAPGTYQDTVVVTVNF